MKKQKLLKNISEVTQTFFVAILVVLFPIVAFTLVTSKSPMLGGVRSYVVLTGSMEPTIQTGSILFVKPERYYKTSDIVAYKSGDVTVTHRISKTFDTHGFPITIPGNAIANYLARQDVTYQTKGDANKISDSKVLAKNDIVGRALFHIPYIGTLVTFLRTVPGFLLLVVLPSLLFIAHELWIIKKEIEKNVEKRLLEKMRASMPTRIVLPNNINLPNN